MNTKNFEANMKMGDIKLITIFDDFDGIKFIVTLRSNLFNYSLEKKFRSAASAFKYALKIIDKPIFSGLSEEYRAMPAIIVNKTYRGENNETYQHEQAAKP